jgi:hypothetical protein
MTVQNPKAGDYAGQFEAPVTVLNVRFEGAAGLVNNGYVLSDGAKGVIYTGLSPLDVQVGALITFRGVEYAVVRVSRFEAYRGALHHYEIEVA